MKNICAALVLLFGNPLNSAAVGENSAPPLETEKKQAQPQSQFERLSRAKKETIRKVFIDKNLAEIQTKCRYKFNELIRVKGNNILCIDGKIIAKKENAKNNKPSPATASNSAGKPGKYQIAYVYSPGGDIKAAMEIGLDIHRNRAILIVDKHCHSACGNYLIPAARRIYMTDNTVISQHGSLPRSLWDYSRIRMRAKYKGEKKLDIKDIDFKALMATVRETTRGYAAHAKQHFLPEFEYFISILSDEAYITRFREIRRTLAKRKNYNCAPKKGLTLIIGPEYLKEFRIKTIREWFPENKADYVKLLEKTSINYSLIYDFDDDPFWLSGSGLVKPGSCRP
jgi:hypothetical protein